MLSDISFSTHISGFHTGQYHPRQYLPDNIPQTILPDRVRVRNRVMGVRVMFKILCMQTYTEKLKVEFGEILATIDRFNEFRFKDKQGEKYFAMLCAVFHFMYGQKLGIMTVRGRNKTAYQFFGQQLQGRFKFISDKKYVL